MAVTTVAFAGTRGHYAATLAEIAAIPQLRVVAVHAACDPVEPLVRWCSEHGHPGRVFDDYDAMLDASRPDLVIVCGPFESHSAMAVAAIRRGIHVLTEKPAAITVPQLESLRAACSACPDVHLAVMLFSRYSPGFATARRLIRSGAIGHVRLIDARKSYKLGVRPEYCRDRATYGGTIPWVGSHAIDWILHLTDNLPFRSVYASHSSLHNGDNRTMESSAVCHFTLEGDVFASISIDYLRPAAAPTHGDDWARVVGTRGTLQVRPDSVLLTTESSGPTPVPVSADTSLLRDFVAHVEGRSRALLDADTTLRLTDACLRALQSADEGRVVRFGQ